VWGPGRTGGRGGKGVEGWREGEGGRGREGGRGGKGEGGRGGRERGTGTGRTACKLSSALNLGGREAGRPARRPAQYRSVHSACPLLLACRDHHNTCVHVSRLLLSGSNLCQQSQGQDSDLAHSIPVDATAQHNPIRAAFAETTAYVQVCPAGWQHRFRHW
jgi:hypothetical protein